jgi:hypothetical protein
LIIDAARFGGGVEKGAQTFRDKLVRIEGVVFALLNGNLASLLVFLINWQCPDIFRVDPRNRQDEPAVFCQINAALAAPSTHIGLFHGTSDPTSLKSY